jgi:hypothetical protein
MSDPTPQNGPQNSLPEAAPEKKELTAAARRALAEAEARRKAQEGAGDGPREIGGRGGKEPVRYGDWEVKGLASDF